MWLCTHKYTKKKWPISSQNHYRFSNLHYFHPFLSRYQARIPANDRVLYTPKMQYLTIILLILMLEIQSEEMEVAHEHCYRIFYLLFVRANYFRPIRQDHMIGLLIVVMWPYHPLHYVNHLHRNKHQ